MNDNDVFNKLTLIFFRILTFIVFILIIINIFQINSLNKEREKFNRDIELRINKINEFQEDMAKVEEEKQILDFEIDLDETNNN
jgi:hypothetical protein